MTAVVFEDPDAWEYDDDESGIKTGRRRFICHNADDEADAISALNAALPLSMVESAVILTNVRYKKIDASDGGFAAVASYSDEPPAKKEPTVDWLYDFEVGLQRQRFTRSLATTIYATGGTAHTHQGLIGWDGDRVQGIDGDVSTQTFSKTRTYPIARITDAYRATLKALAGGTNASSYDSHAAGEVRFLGARGRSVGSEKFELNLVFGVSENATGISIGPITGIAKKGWEAIEPQYREKIDPTTGITYPVPQCVFVHQVFPSVNFANLEPPIV